MYFVHFLKLLNFTNNPNNFIIECLCIFHNFTYQTHIDRLLLYNPWNILNKYLYIYISYNFLFEAYNFKFIDNTIKHLCCYVVLLDLYFNLYTYLFCNYLIFILYILLYTICIHIHLVCINITHSILYNDIYTDIDFYYHLISFIINILYIL